jgi:calcineurin-like phosphoesterase family protein
MKKRLDKEPFFISDLHIGHHNIIKYDGRPFESIEEMHTELIKRWNSVVGKDDIVYHLGDLSMRVNGFTKWFVHELNGKIYHIMGNHDDYDDIKSLGRFEDIHEYGTEIMVYDPEETNKRTQGYQQIILSHYPILSWNRSHYSSWHLHGHCHGSLMKQNGDYYKRKVMDVGCNVIDYTPISYQQVKSVMSGRIISGVDHH